MKSNKEDTPKFHAVTKADKEQFLKLAKPKSKAKLKRPKDRKDAAEDPQRQRMKQKYEGPFAIIDPIQTRLGPIGKWIPDLEHLPKSPSIVAFGKRRTGKSFSCRWILYNCFRHIPFGIVCSHTSFDGFWQQYVPEKFVFQGLPEHRLNALMERQKRLIKKFRKEFPGRDIHDDPSLEAFIILDDVVSIFMCVKCPHSSYSFS